MNGIMLQGTSSDSGKSFIATGLCRLLSRSGVNVCPFKSQNMSNNAYVTHDGKEISTAQAVQAQAAGLTPEAFMNPILLKPNHDKSSEIILDGHVFAHDTRNYHAFTENQGINAVRKSLAYIASHFQAVIIEGAGSPAEVNLNAHEIVNMRIAREADVPVILVADVDRGGSLASVAGTLELLGPDRERVRGIIYNKFRGDISLFRSAVEWTENYTGVHVVGVVPYVPVNIPGEDSLDIKNTSGGRTRIGVVNYPGISNFSDFDALTGESLTYIDGRTSIQTFHDLDAIILPGTKNTFAALEWLRSTGLDSAITHFTGKIFGICGGLQIMGMLGIIPASTSFADEKITRQVHGMFRGENISGYEIHYGRTDYVYDDKFFPLLKIDGIDEGITSRDFRIAGTYIHGIFSNENFRSSWLGTNYAPQTNDDPFDVIADTISENLDMDYIMQLIHHEDTMLLRE